MKRIMSKALALLLSVGMILCGMTGVVSAAQTDYGYEVVVDISAADGVRTATVTVRLTDYTAGKSGIRGFQIDISDVDDALAGAECTSLVSDTQEVFANTAGYQSSRDLVRHVYAKMSGTMSYTQSDLMCLRFEIPDAYTEENILSLPMKLLIQNEAGDEITYTSRIDIVSNTDTTSVAAIGDEKFDTLNEAMAAAQAGDTVKLLRDAEEKKVTVLAGVTLDLDGHKLDTTYTFCVGDLVDDSVENSGELVADYVMIREDNEHLPVRVAENTYRFYEVLGFNATDIGNTSQVKYAFQPLFEASAHEDLLLGRETTGVSILVRVTWTRPDDTDATQDFVYQNSHVDRVINSYNPATGKYGRMYTLTLNNADSYENLKYQVYVVSETGASFTIGHTGEVAGR